jgi:hypothetical protein
MSTHILATTKDGQQRSVSIDNLPDECPICHNVIIPNSFSMGYYFPEKWNRGDCLQVIYRCPKLDCQKLFIGNYKANSSACEHFSFEYSQPCNKIDKKFSDTITKISNNFTTIYNQSFRAEQDGLLEICGVGYRKSLEFLIKDYLIKLDSTKEAEIKIKFLGKCIEEDIKNENIKNVAKRATWLGNDETHYLKKWEGKDLQDLKNLIDLTVHWLEMEDLTQKAIDDMPEKT